jgi:hypothetical protein
MNYGIFAPLNPAMASQLSRQKTNKQQNEDRKTHHRRGLSAMACCCRAREIKASNSDDSLSYALGVANYIILCRRQHQY